MQTIMSSENKINLISLSKLLKISLSCLIALVRISSKMLKINGGSRHACLVFSCIRRNSIFLYQICFSINALCHIKNYFQSQCTENIFIHEASLYFINDFVKCSSTTRLYLLYHTILVLYYLNVANYTILLFNTEDTLH